MLFIKRTKTTGKPRRKGEGGNKRKREINYRNSPFFGFRRHNLNYSPSIIHLVTRIPWKQSFFTAFFSPAQKRKFYFEINVVFKWSTCSITVRTQTEVNWLRKKKKGTKYFGVNSPKQSFVFVDSCSSFFFLLDGLELRIKRFLRQRIKQSAERASYSIRFPNK